MAFLTALIEVILPVVLVALGGVALARRFRLDMDTVGKINLYGLTPLLAFDSVMRTEVSCGQAVQLVGGYLLATAVAGLIALAAAWGRDGPTRRAMIAAVVIGNNGNFGLPIALLALGRAGLDQAVVIFVTSLVVMYTVGPALLGSHGGVGDAVLTVVRLPVAWALVAGLIVRTSGVTLPVGIARGVELLAQAAIPMVLIALGLQLGQRSSLKLTAPVLIAAAVRVALATNQHRFRGSHMREHLRLDDHVDAAYYSFEQGVAKPDAAFFTRILDDLGDPPGSVLFIDDLPGNVRAARRLGIDARLHLWRTGAAGLRRTLASRL